MIQRRILCICLLSFGLLQAQEWQLQKKSDHIKVYTRQLDSTQFNEYKAVLTAKTTPEKALKVICDGDRLWEWNHKTAKSEEVLSYNDSTFVIWMLNDLPWPLRDRENLSLIKVSEPRPGNYYVDISPADNSLRKTPEDVIRTTRFKGHWKIRALRNGMVEVTQQLYGDPNGIIPAWLLNSIITNVPFHSFENLKVILEN
ncbi:lipid-binding protein [Robertkochia marina]|uniref:Lipid-binding protein n=1 Tax=Robertkochia marina TaxID=1227945 RepID=A0A4S3M347_9FLAO|nr:START domain-containing protein [Robertkochia marina]THD69109.1 lipid-binding protein [Robertkochia marina]TRZ47632.1 lipid-binding protein [Robertkochia marina]